MKRRLKVFHGLVNYGTQAGFLASGLRKYGVAARSYVQPDPFNRVADVHFKSGGSILRKVWIHCVHNFVIRVLCVFKYNVFHFYYGTSLLPYHLDLPLLKMMGKTVVHHYLGHDVEGYAETRERYGYSNMDHWGEEQGQKHDKRIKRRLAFESKYSDLKLVCAPQYSPFVPDAIFVPLAIDLGRFQFALLPVRDYSKVPVRIIHAPTNRAVKGTAFLESAVHRLKSDGWSVELKICEGMSHDQLMIEYALADFAVISLVGGWYGTSAVEAMAIGRGVVAFLREEYFNYVDGTFKDDIPIVNANTESVYVKLIEILTEGNYRSWGAKSRDFVEKYHDMDEVCKVLLKLYEERVWRND